MLDPRCCAKGDEGRGGGVDRQRSFQSGAVGKKKTGNRGLPSCLPTRKRGGRLLIPSRTFELALVGWRTKRRDRTVSAQSNRAKLLGRPSTWDWDF